MQEAWDAHKPSNLMPREQRLREAAPRLQLRSLPRHVYGPPTAPQQRRAAQRPRALRRPRLRRSLLLPAAAAMQQRWPAIEVCTGLCVSCARECSAALWLPADMRDRGHADMRTCGTAGLEVGSAWRASRLIGTPARKGEAPAEEAARAAEAAEAGAELSTGNRVRTASAASLLGERTSALCLQQPDSSSPRIPPQATSCNLLLMPASVSVCDWARAPPSAANAAAPSVPSPPRLASLLLATPSSSRALACMPADAGRDAGPTPHQAARASAANSAASGAAGLGAAAAAAAAAASSADGCGHRTA